MRDTIDAACAAKANIAPWRIDRPTWQCDRCVSASAGPCRWRRALFIKGQLLPAAFSQGKNRFVSNFNHHLRCLAIIVALLVAAPFFAAPVGAQSIGQAGPSSGIIAEQQQIIDGLNEADRRFRDARSRPAATTTPALVEIRLQLEDMRTAAAEERSRLSAAARRDQRQDRAARAAAGRGPAGRTGHRHAAKGRRWSPKRPRSTPCLALPKTCRCASTA